MTRLCVLKLAFLGQEGREGLAGSSWPLGHDPAWPRPAKIGNMEAWNGFQEFSSLVGGWRFESSRARSDPDFVSCKDTKRNGKGELLPREERTSSLNNAYSATPMYLHRY